VRYACHAGWNGGAGLVPRLVERHALLGCQRGNRGEQKPPVGRRVNAGDTSVGGRREERKRKKFCLFASFSSALLVPRVIAFDLTQCVCVCVCLSVCMRCLRLCLLFVCLSVPASLYLSVRPHGVSATSCLSLPFVLWLSDAGDGEAVAGSHVAAAAGVYGQLPRAIRSAVKLYRQRSAGSSRVTGCFERHG
jgi:hypothetical protein